MNRRDLLAAMATLAVAPSRARASQAPDPSAALRALEARAGGRLGVCFLDTATGRRAGQRLDERFAMCSTFKLPLAAIILREADRGRLRLSDLVTFSQQDMVPHAPVTSTHLDKGEISIGTLAEAIQVTSDNVAANLLLKRIGGPAVFTAAMRAWGDTVTRLDRYEPDLNLVLPGEEHDTTSPAAMAGAMAEFLTGSALEPASRERLVGWMVATRTGAKRLRAGLPATWRAGDKTGTANTAAMTDKINDVAAAWPPGRPPILVTAYYDAATRSSEITDAQQAILAEVGRIAAGWAG